MGKAIIQGGGGGAPRNSVKVLEYAGEDIPANCFVSKIEGANAKNQGYSFNSNYIIKATIPIKDDEYICVLTQQTAEMFAYMKGVKVLNSVEATHSSVLSQKSLSIVHLKDSKKIVYLFRSNAYEYKTFWSIVITYDTNGKLTMSKIQSDVNQDHDDIGWRYFVSGDYSNGYMYAISMKNDNNSYLEKWKLSNNSMSFVNSQHINRVLVQSNGNDDTPVYIEEFDRIYSMFNDDVVVQINPSTLQCQSGNVTVLGRKWVLSKMACYRGTYLVDIQRRRLWITTERYSSSNISLYYIDIDTFTSYVYMTSVTSNGFSLLSFDILDKTQNTLYALTNNQVTKIDLANKKVISKESMSIYSGIVNGIRAWVKGALQFYVWADGYYEIYFNKYSIGTVILPDKDSPIYGISQKNIKAYEQGTIYALSDTQTTSVYGIPQELADTIVDDGIIEVQNAVVDGKE